MAPKPDLQLTVVGGEQWSKGLPGDSMPSEVKAKAEEPRRACRKVDRLTKNLENWLTQAVGFGRTPESERGHQDPPLSLPYQERTGHRLAKR